MSSEAIRNLFLKVEKTKLRKSFLNQCIENKIIPTGLRFRFHIAHKADDQASLQSEITGILNEASSRILDHLLKDIDICLQRDMTTLRNSIDSFHSRNNQDITSNLHRRFNPILHNIKQNHHKKIIRLKTRKHQTPSLFHSSSHQYIISQRQPPFTKRVRASRRRLRKRSVTTPTTTSTSQAHGSSRDDSNLVICSPPTINLTQSEKSILSKGLKFIPLEKFFNHQKAMDDAHRFMRTLRLKFYFANKNNKNSNNNPQDVFAKFEAKKSNWTPPAGESDALDYFIKKTTQDLSRVNPPPLKRSNITHDERQALLSLSRRKDIVIKPADKGGSVVVWSKTAYTQEANRQLDDGTFYAPVAMDKTVPNNEEAKSTITRLIESDDLPNEAKSLLLHPSELGKPCFYMLPKIHKMKDMNDLPLGRPIVSAISCPTEKISQFLDGIFQKIVTNLPTYIKDTNDVLNILKNTDLCSTTNEWSLFTMDVKALYTSIPHSDGLQAIRHFVEHHPTPDVSPTAIVRLTELVLTLNSFEFNGCFFDQISGVAMGTKMGPSYANLFMGFLESKLHSQYTGPIPFLFKRYIDDCLGITSMPMTDILSFIEFMNNLHPSIKFTHEISSSTVDFLDIKISIISGTIQTSVYYKPTDSHSYLLYSSSHPKRCKDSIPYSQFLRLRRLCSDDADFREQCSILAEFFEHRGYSHDIVRKASNQVRDISRDHCLQSSRKSSTTERPTMVLSYHPNARLYTDIVKRNFISILHGDANTRRVFPDVPMTAYRRDRSLKDRLVHSRIFAPSTGCMQKCGRRRCGTCNHLHREAEITFPKGKRSVIRASCVDRNLIYALICKECSKSYIGQTGKRLGDRFMQHLRDIRDDNDKPVARHFNSPGHHGTEDVEVAVISILAGSEHQRRATETHLIRTLGTYPDGMNEKIDTV